MSKVLGISLTIVFVTLSSVTTFLLWEMFGWFVGVQVVAILIIGAYGEHHVSGRGYYYYTPLNGLFIGRVPAYIPFMWVSVIQATYLTGLLSGLIPEVAILTSGALGLCLDFAFVEPYFSRVKGFWLWKQVDRGYFGFVPPHYNRFTAPVGNYLVWLGFPAILNWFLAAMVLLAKLL